ncbi:MAG: right-handed parallel beta-helix repeat-containing protein [Phycisphaerales bacterium]|nr:right-handed parallel beta-helix repeat-containing protein [Phycisphaerales bacterium]
MRLSCLMLFVLMFSASTILAQSASKKTIPNDTVLPAALAGVQKDDLVTLAATKQPHKLVGDYNVPPGKKLVIEAGATVLCDKDSVLSISGTLEANGEAQKPIIFRGAKSTPGIWKGILFESVNNADYRYLYVSDAVDGVTMTKSKIHFSHCIFAGNQNGFHLWDGSHSELKECVLSLNAKSGLRVGGTSLTIISCTISKNGEWGIRWPVASLNITKSIITGNKGGGINGWSKSPIVMKDSVLTGNAGMDVKNSNAEAEWDLRGNFWGAALTKSLKANKGVVSSPAIVGKVRMDEFLEERPKACGASVTSLGGQKLW